MRGGKDRKTFDWRLDRAKNWRRFGIFRLHMTGLYCYNPNNAGKEENHD
jgi:hypothetical protein